MGAYRRCWSVYSFNTISSRQHMKVPAACTYNELDDDRLQYANSPYTPLACDSVDTCADEVSGAGSIESRCNHIESS